MRRRGWEAVLILATACANPSPPVEWSLEKGKQRNLAWKGKLGSLSTGSPRVADGVVWVGTNADRGKAGGLLLAFRASDGAALGRHFSPLSESWRPVTSSPLVEGDRLWYVNPRGEVSCLDLSDLREGSPTLREVWKTDLVTALGVTLNPNMMYQGVYGSIGASYRGKIYVSTGNAVDPRTDKMTSPDAPTLVCLDKKTGEILGRDAPEIAAGTRVRNTSSPVVVEFGRGGRVVFGGGDGFLYAFDADPDPATRTLRKLWRVDCSAGRPERTGLSTPAIHEGRAYVMLGDELDEGSAPGTLTCVDLASGTLLWQDREVERSLSTPVIHEGVVYSFNLTGYLRAHHAVTGARLWTYDSMAMSTATPLIVDGRLYACTWDDEVLIFDVRGAAAKAPTLLKKMTVPNLQGAPVFSDGTLYFPGGSWLYAIRELGQDSRPASDGPKRGRAPRALFVPTPRDVAANMLEFAKVGAADLVCDLGSGDGRIPLAAANTYGCRARGVEIDPELLATSRAADVDRKVQWIEGDLFAADISDATVVTLFLGMSNNAKLLPKLRALKPGVRIVSHQHLLGPEGPPPDRTVKMVSSEDHSEHTFHLWTTPLAR